MSETTRICRRCGLEKAIADFPTSVEEGRLRIRRRCKVCELLRSREPKKKTQDRANARRYRADGRVREKDRRLARRRHERYPEKLAATRALNAAIRQGKIIRPSQCSRCGDSPQPKRNGAPRIQAHHPDYSQPLSVVWLCEPCHIREHHEAGQ